MKVTEAIKKAREEHPELEPVANLVLAQKDGKPCGACAIGLALVGSVGLEETQKLCGEFSRAKYNKFEEIFGVEPYTVHSVNDSLLFSGESFDAVLKELEELGL